MPTAFRRISSRSLVLSMLAMCAFAVAARADDASADPQQQAFFETKIRPVLVESCYECHAGDEAEGGLQLDSAAGLISGGDSGPAIEPGEPEVSLLLSAIRYEEMEMPPSGRLPAAVVADFAQWISHGAFDPRGPSAPTPTHHSASDLALRAENHRAFRPVDATPPPVCSDAAWPTSDVDAYLLAKLETAGMSPAPRALPGALSRRVHYDLTGLPPSVAERAESTDGPPDALLRTIDRLVASPGYGVQWGRHWLDVARYADSNGGDFNATFHNAWRYRDYVIDAFANDKPFDQFVREQIAGDLLPASCDDERAEQIIATGFLALGAKMLSERDKAKLRMDVVDEQISAVGSAFLGLTLGCARCHDHKFDPIPTEDYYALAGVFRSTRTLEGEIQQYVSDWIVRDLPAAPEHVAAVEKHKKVGKLLADELSAAKKSRDALKTRLAASRTASLGLVLDEDEARLVGEWKRSTHSPKHLDAGYLHDDQSGKGEKSVVFKVAVPRSATYEVRVVYNAGPSRADNVPATVRHAGGETTATVNQQRPPELDGVCTAIGRFEFSSDSPGEVVISNAGTTGHVIVDAVLLVEIDETGEPVASGDADAEIATIEAELAFAEAQVAECEARVAEHAQQAPPPLPQALAIVEEDAAEIADSAVRIRGDYRNLGELVERGPMQTISFRPRPAAPADESGRRELAEWIADPRNPLTARVIVNRVWTQLTAGGIVASVDNFGVLGDRPSHPELLDRLAADFIDDDWSVKRLVRRLAATSSYAMSAEFNEAAWQVDPDNRLRWRANRRRLTAEELRDSLLVAGDRLDLSPGESAVGHLGKLINNNNVGAEEYEQEASPRRSIYLPIIRNELPPMLAAFDFADPEFVVGRRNTTNTPAQALFLLNSPQVMAAATATADRIAANTSDDAAQITAAYGAVLAREPSVAELDRAIGFLVAERRHGAPTGALARLVQALFCSTEFRTLE